MSIIIVITNVIIIIIIIIIIIRVAYAVNISEHFNHQINN